MQEGRTILSGTIADTPPDAAGPGRREPDAPFYNPAMRINRDLSVLLLRAEVAGRAREIDIADVLAGAGARSVRIAREVPGELIVHANDADPRAIAAIEEAARRNEVAARIQTTEGPARAFLSSRRFDVVDIDPFGSPMPFLDAAMQATRHDGLLCITATDTGALSGTYPKACRRRYGAEPLHAVPWRAEAGLRILITAGIRAAGRVDRAATPVFSVAQGHWMRTVLRIRDDRKAADASARSIRPMSFDEQTMQAVPGEGGAGPMWTGALHDADTVTAMAAGSEREGIDSRTSRLVAAMAAEADGPIGWCTTAMLAKRLGGDTPRRDRFLGALRERGHKTWPSHIDKNGIRTDATPDEVGAAWSSLF